MDTWSLCQDFSAYTNRSTSAQAVIHSLPVTDAVARYLPAWTPQAADESELEQLLRRASLSAGSVLHLDYHPRTS